MTREEIIKSALKFLAQKQTEQGSWGFSDDNDNEVSWNEVIEWLDQQPWKDYISRELVIEWLKDKDIIKTKNQEENARKKLAELPSVTLNHRIGRWIPVEGVYGIVKGVYECSECGRTIFLDDEETSYEDNPYGDYPYCHCGAKMIKP